MKSPLKSLCCTDKEEKSGDYASVNNREGRRRYPVDSNTIDGRVRLLVRKRVAVELEFAPERGQFRWIAVAHGACKSSLPCEAWNSLWSGA